jgi:hypothetical protein
LLNVYVWKVKTLKTSEVSWRTSEFSLQNYEPQRKIFKTDDGCSLTNMNGFSKICRDTHCELIFYRVSHCKYSAEFDLSKVEFTFVVPKFLSAKWCSKSPVIQFGWSLWYSAELVILKYSVEWSLWIFCSLRILQIFFSFPLNKQKMLGTNKALEFFMFPIFDETFAYVMKFGSFLRFISPDVLESQSSSVNSLKFRRTGAENCIRFSYRKLETKEFSIHISRRALGS